MYAFAHVDGRRLDWLSGCPISREFHFLACPPRKENELPGSRHPLAERMVPALSRRRAAFSRSGPLNTCQTGFSLLEVVVAFAILALSLGLLIQVFSQAMNTTALSGTYSRAATLAEARLNSVGVEIELEPGTHTGEPEDGLGWQVSIEPYDLGEVPWEPALEPLLVTASVFWEEALGRRQIVLSTLRLVDSSGESGFAALPSPASPKVEANR